MPKTGNQVNEVFAKMLQGARGLTVNLLREYIKELLEFSIKANRKNTHQDGTSKSRGYMSGKDIDWSGEDVNDKLHNWYKKMVDGFNQKQSVYHMPNSMFTKGENFKNRSSLN